MNRSLTLTTVLLALGLVGCAAPGAVQVDYEAANGTTTYVSARAVMGHRAMRGGLAANQRVMWQAVASCAGRACTPEEVALVFYNDSNTDLNLDYRRLQIDFGKMSRIWEDENALETRPAASVPRGEFIRVPLTGAEFAWLATADVVSVYLGRSGTSQFSIPHERRAAFRDFAERAGLNQ